MNDMASFLDIPVYTCPVDGCDWKLSQLDYEQNRPLRVELGFDEHGFLKSDMGEIAKHVDQLLRGHLETHDVFDWVRTVHRLNQDLSQTGAIRPHVYDFHTGGHIV